MKRRVRPARREDLPRLHEIERGCFPGPEQLTRGQLASLAFRVDIAPLVAELDGRIVGFALVHFHGRAARLLTIDVAEEARGKGCGRALLDAADEAAREAGCDAIGLEVRVGNRAAIAMYERAGYARLRTVHDYYPDESGEPEDAYEMEKRLTVPQ
jgi:ribosomal-protein-alanine acetyltransferase